MYTFMFPRWIFDRCNSDDWSHILRHLFSYRVYSSNTRIICNLHHNCYGSPVFIPKRGCHTMEAGGVNDNRITRLKKFGNIHAFNMEPSIAVSCKITMTVPKTEYASSCHAVPSFLFVLYSMKSISNGFMSCRKSSNCLQLIRSVFHPSCTCHGI